MATKTEKTAVNKALDKFVAEVNKSNDMSKAIERGGDRIRIPETMGFQDAADVLHKLHERQEEMAANQAEFIGHPSECLVALDNAMRETFGVMASEATFSFFGMIPALHQTVQVSYKDSREIPVGTVSAPGLPLTLNVMPLDVDHPKYINKGIGLVVQFEYQRKFEAIVHRIIDATRSELRTHPLFKGQAISSSFEFIDLSGFDPARIVYTAKEERVIQANILNPIEHTREWVRAGFPLKRGILLHGKYGTGKSLTALLAAQTCIKNGWTFINVNTDNGDVAGALRTARRYEPAMVFCEDIDKETGKSRTTRVNDILDTIDGILSKDSKVMVILTTNHIEQVNRAMLRPGRLDSVIELGDLDAPAVKKLVMVLANGAVIGDLNEEKLYNAAHGYVPAYVAEAVTKAYAYSLGSDHAGRITEEDVIAALEELRPQYNLMNTAQESRKVDVAEVIAAKVGSVINSALSTKLQPIYNEIGSDEPEDEEFDGDEEEDEQD